MGRSLFILLVLAFSASLQNVESSKILMVFPMPSYSHFSLNFRIGKELADRGHEVTAINPYPQKTPIKNYKDISVVELESLFEELRKDLFNMNSWNPIHTMNFIIDMGQQMTEKTFQNEQVQKLLQSDEKFDVMIIEHFLDEALVGLAHHFNIPTILLSSTAVGAMNAHLFANPLPSSYIPNAQGDFTKHMNFFQRTQNFLMNIVGDLMRECLLMPSQRELFKKYIKTDLELDDILYNVSLILSNSHVSVNDAVPYVPSVIEIGGYHVKPPQKLPADLQKFLDDSKNGVILFSMGSNLQSKDLKQETRDAFLKAFSKLKQNVLWKFEEDNIPNAPKNLKIMKWIPQQDVLAHPNVKAFISHGGLLSSIETVYHGKPIIGIPVFADQESNIARAAANGYAIALPLEELTEEKLSKALDEILNNPKYTENVQRRSRVINDQPLKPIDTAIYWIEHVIRHKGAPHLRSAGLDLKWYQRELIDVIAFLALVTITSLAIFCIVTKKILGLCFGKKAKVTTKVTKQKKNK